MAQQFFVTRQGTDKLEDTPSSMTNNTEERCDSLLKDLNRLNKTMTSMADFYKDKGRNTMFNSSSSASWVVENNRLLTVTIGEVQVEISASKTGSLSKSTVVSRNKP